MISGAPPKAAETSGGSSAAVSRAARKDEECVPALDDIPVVEHRLLNRHAVEQGAISRLEILDHPAPQRLDQLRMGGGHPWIGDAQIELTLAIHHRARHLPLAPAKDHHLKVAQAMSRGFEQRPMARHDQE